MIIFIPVILLQFFKIYNNNNVELKPYTKKI